MRLTRLTRYAVAHLFRRSGGGQADYPRHWSTMGLRRRHARDERGRFGEAHAEEALRMFVRATDVWSHESRSRYRHRTMQKEPPAGTRAAHGITERRDGCQPRVTAPTLFLTVGLPGTGKTTLARRIEVERQALRLTKDEWMKALYGQENPAASDVIEGRLIRIGMRALELGTNVVIDFGLWSREERCALRRAAADVGAEVVILYCTVTAAEQRRRLDERLARSPHDTWPMSDDELAGYAATFDVPTPAELDGSDTIDEPPVGFATWHEWIASRWPRALG